MEEPVIVHGYTFVPEISAREVLEAIAESAFKTSDYPLVLSFENHCNPRQQAKIANYCSEIFGDMLLDAPLENYKVEPGKSFFSIIGLLLGSLVKPNVNSKSGITCDWSYIFLYREAQLRFFLVMQSPGRG